VTKPKGKPLIDVLFADERGRGGRRRNAGGHPRDPKGRGRPVTVYLSPTEQEAALRHGHTVQDGIRNLLRK